MIPNPIKIDQICGIVGGSYNTYCGKSYEKAVLVAPTSRFGRVFEAVLVDGSKLLFTHDDSRLNCFKCRQTIMAREDQELFDRLDAIAR